jgi:hypothetical protein
VATEQDLKAARTEFEEAFSKAALSRTVRDPRLIQLARMTQDDLDDFPIREQIARLRGATTRFREYAMGRDDLDDMPNLYIRVPKR